MSVGDVYVGFLDADLPCADGFDLRAVQDEARFECFHEEVFKAGFTVVGDDLYGFCHGLILPLIYKLMNC